MGALVGKEGEQSQVRSNLPPTETEIYLLFANKGSLTGMHGLTLSTRTRTV